MICNKRFPMYSIFQRKLMVGTWNLLGTHLLAFDGHDINFRIFRRFISDL